MISPEQAGRAYQNLGEWYQKTGDVTLRDRHFVLAADAFLAAGKREEAERIRTRLSQLNPHHLLKPYASLAQAMTAADVQNYIDGLRRNYPRETALQLWESVQGSEGAGKGGLPPVAAPLSPTMVPLKDASKGPAPEIYLFKDVQDAPPGIGGGRMPAPSTPLTSVARLSRSGIAPEWDDPDRPEAQSGAWVSTILFCLVLVAGVALAAYTFARPFMSG